MARTSKSNVNIYFSASDGSTIKQSYSDASINPNSATFAAAIASVNGALDATLPGGGRFADVWYKDRDSMGVTDTKITGIVCVQEETVTQNDVYGTRP